MQSVNPGINHKKRAVTLILAATILLVGLLFGGQLKNGLRKLITSDISNQEEGQILGLMPDPTQPDFLDPLFEPFSSKKTKKVAIRHIPRLEKGAIIPHPYWGSCDKCHLIKGGLPAGSQWKSPFGKALEKVSTFKKVGPPILPNSSRLHPPAGRCIKCHDIVIEVPL